jgi:voltage-dependent potassium channel beta subunit
MEYRRLGKSGLQVSALSLGSWLTFGKQIGDDVAEEMMKVAYDNGINFFDNAEIYARGQSEIVMWKIVKKMDGDRSTYTVSAKVFWGGDQPNQKGLMRTHIVEACHAALKRFQLDYLDLFFCHRPDIHTPIVETAWSMHNLILQGKILYWGTSEWSAQQITEAHLVCEKYNLIKPVMEQPQYNMFHREKMEMEYLPLFENFGLGTTIWSPLASGLLTGKYLDDMPGDTRLSIEGLDWLKERVLGDESKIEKTRKLFELSKELEIPLTQFALAWCLKNPNVSTVILGGSKVNHMKENLKALEVAEKLTEEVMQSIEGILENKPEIQVF